MPNPWNGKAVLEVFWWNCWNTSYPGWYTYLAKLAPTLAILGFDGIWTPPALQGNDVHKNMGYTHTTITISARRTNNGGVGNSVRLSR